MNSKTRNSKTRNSKTRNSKTVDRDDLVRRVSALLAKAASTDHEPERQAFEAKAQALITRYQITQGELGATGGETEQTIDVEGWGNATRGVVFLWSGVAEINQCATAHHLSRGRAKVILVGDETNTELTIRLIEHLLPQLRLALLHDRPRSRMSYAIGWSQRVVDRLGQVREQAARDAAKATGLDPEAGSGLIPTNEAALDALHEAYRVRRGRSTTVDADEYGSGSAAGASVDLGQPGVKSNAGSESNRLDDPGNRRAGN